MRSIRGNSLIVRSIKSSQTRTVFETMSDKRNSIRSIRSPKEVREMLEIAESFDNVPDRVQYLDGIGIDYERVCKYLPIVESLNRQWTRNTTKWWKFVYDVVMFTVSLMSSRF